MSQPPIPRLPPQLRAWLEHERIRGAQMARAIARQRRLLPAAADGLERFKTRMALVELTGTVASWANGLHDALGKAEISEAAAALALGPPFAATEPTTSDYERLGDFVETCMDVLEQVLASDAARPK